MPFSTGTSVRARCIYGGTDTSDLCEVNRRDAQPFHVLVATPGRLLDHLQHAAYERYPVGDWFLRDR